MPARIQLAYLATSNEYRSARNCQAESRHGSTEGRRLARCRAGPRFLRRRLHRLAYF
jgi:hypothetical protein